MLSGIICVVFPGFKSRSTGGKDLFGLKVVLLAVFWGLMLFLLVLNMFSWSVSRGLQDFETTKPQD